MKFEDYKDIERSLEKALERLEMIYEEHDTSEDEQWSLDLDQAIQNVRSLKESMIYCFEIEEG